MMRQEKPNQAGSPDTPTRTAVRGRELKLWVMAVWYALTNPLLRLRNAWLRLRIARLHRQVARSEEQLGRHGINPATLPGMPELKQVEQERLRAEDDG